MSDVPSTPTTTSTSGTVDLAIDGMSCGHCVAAVRDALGDVDGVAVERVGVGAATIHVGPEGADAVRAAIHAVSDAGYPARVTAPRAGA